MYYYYYYHHHHHHYHYLTAIGLTPGGSSTVHRIQRTEHTKQLQKNNNKNEGKKELTESW
jgi:hypothetical protein